MGFQIIKGLYHYILIMCAFDYSSKKDLLKKVCSILNENGFSFISKEKSQLYDLKDEKQGIYGQVRIDNQFNPLQLLFLIIKKKPQKIEYFILANNFELRVYHAPGFENVQSFLQKNGITEKNLSQKQQKEVQKKAFQIIGMHYQIYTYKNTFHLNKQQPYIFLNKLTFPYFKRLMTKYRIDPAKFIHLFANVWMNESKIIVKKNNLTIYDPVTQNKMNAGREICSFFDKELICHIRIKRENIRENLHRIDSLTPLDVRRNRGKFWSSLEISKIAKSLLMIFVNPTFLFEPFVGGGNLIHEFVAEIPGIANDIDSSSIHLLKQKWEKFSWKFYSRNLFRVPQREINYEWEIPSKEETERFLIYTNPPFGTSSTSKLASLEKDKERMNQLQHESRAYNIDYGFDAREEEYFTNKYGKGDLVIPAIARMIETIRHRHDGYLAFFSPFGIFTGKSRYVKLLKVLLQDFQFLYGEIFGGDMFNNVNENKPIAFSIWKYQKDSYTQQKDLSFWHENKKYTPKFLPLLKEGWKCYNGNISSKKQENVLGVFRNNSFNTLNPKIFSLDLKEGSGSALIPENVKKELMIPNVPSRLGYALWSICVGMRSLTQHPLVFDNCYTHLPNFQKKETMEILAYAVMHTIITEIKQNYCGGQIGFTNNKKTFQFGDHETTKGAKFLLTQHKDCPLGELSIYDVYLRLKKGESPDDIDKNLRIHIRHEIQKRLDQIEYWKDLPVPRLNEILPKKSKGLLRFLSKKEKKIN